MKDIAPAPPFMRAGIGAGATVLINLHREGILAGRTLRYAKEAASQTWREIRVLLKIVVVLDRADERTERIARGFLDSNVTLHSVDFGNLGKSRQFGVDHIDSELIFFLDGDDFVSYNWFALAIRYLSEAQNARHICHTHYFVGFGEEKFIRIGIDSRDPHFCSTELALDWFFCNNLACRKSVFDSVPLSGYDHSIGIGAEDWHWSAEVLSHGFSHVVIPDTVYFYRTKPPGLSLGMAGEYLPWASQAFRCQLDLGSSESASSDRDFLGRSLETKVPLEIAETVRRAALPVSTIEPSISYLLDRNADLRIFFPSVNQRCLTLHEQINKQDQKVIVVADPTDFPGGLVSLLRFCRLVAGECRFLLLVDDPGEPLRRDVDDGTVINFASVEVGWQAEHHGARVLGRLAIDSRPKKFFVLGAPRLIRWLGRFALQVASFSEDVAIVNVEPAIDPLSRLPFHDMMCIFPLARYVFVSPKAAMQAKVRNWAAEWDGAIAQAFFASIGIDCADVPAPSLGNRSQISPHCQSTSLSNQPLFRFIDQREFFPVSDWKSRYSESQARYAIVSDGEVEISASIESDFARPVNQAAMRLNSVLLLRQFGIRRPDSTIIIHRNEYGDAISTMGKLLTQRLLIVPVAVIDQAISALPTKRRSMDGDEFWARMIVEIGKANLEFQILVGNTIALLQTADEPFSRVRRATLVKFGRS